MRADMAKVIVERPRIAYRAWTKPKGYARRQARFGDDGPPRHEGMLARWGGGTKELNEHLGPLRRYLDRQVGRPWDAVFSEICQRINRNSAVQDHVRDHVEQYVVRHVILVDGVPCCGTGEWYGQPLHQRYYACWYVCPHTGLLRRMKAPPRRPTVVHVPHPSPYVWMSYSRQPYVRLSDTLQARFIRGSWRVVTLKPLPVRSYSRGRSRDVDVLLGRSVTRISAVEAESEYGAAVYAVAVRPLTLREQRQYAIPARPRT
jgi:hypothetical protein